MSRGSDTREDETSLRVLVVEDHQMVARTHERWLRAWRASEVVVASTYDEAIARLSAAPFDLCVLDMQIPGGSGMDVVQHALRRTPPPHIIVVSGEITRTDAHALGQLGVPFYEKPIDGKTLLRAIDEQLQSPRRAATRLHRRVTTADGVTLNREKVTKALEAHAFDTRAAAAALGISRPQLFLMMEKHAIRHRRGAPG